MGCNAVRMSHNPHMPELYSLCDALGFLVIDEAFDEWEAPKNKWSTGHNVYPPKHEGYYSCFPEWHERDLTDLIRRDRNHPCVMLWSIGNDNPARPDAQRLAVLSKMLCDIVHRTDSTHPATLQSFWSAQSMIYLVTILKSESRKTSWGESFPNGESLGIYTKAPDADCILLDLPFAPGTLKALGCGPYRSVSHSLTSCANACTIRLEAYDPTKNTPAMNMTHVSALLSHSEVVQLTATLLDADGNRCIHASTLLHVQVTGARHDTLSRPAYRSPQPVSLP